MKPGRPLTRRTPLTSSTPLPRSNIGRNAGPKQVPAKPKRQRDTGPTQAVRKLVFARADGVCEFPFCLADIDQLHHRRPRRMGGTSDPATNLPSNLVALCQPHHASAESNRTDSLNAGLLLHANQDPAQVPVMLCHGRVFLLDDGGVSTVAPVVQP